MGINDIILNFSPISLNEMDNVKFMERTDNKYVFPFQKLADVLSEMVPYYRLLNINNVCNQTYNSLYFDTDDMTLYRKHYVGKPDRFKFRSRIYVDSEKLTFFEVKHKNNKGITNKKRIKIPEVHELLLDDENNFICNHSNINLTSLKPKLWVNYKRLTFVNKFIPERLTIDTDLYYQKTNSDEKIYLPQFVIAETKHETNSEVSHFVRIIRKNGVREGSISKYCFGVYSLFDNVPKNNFKPKVRFIYKMSNTYNNLKL